MLLKTRDIFFRFIVSLLEISQSKFGLQDLASIFVRIMPDVQCGERVATLGHYGEIRAARQCAATHFLVNSWSPASASARKDLSFRTVTVLQLTIAFAVC